MTDAIEQDRLGIERSRPACSASRALLARTIHSMDRSGSFPACCRSIRPRSCRVRPAPGRASRSSWFARIVRSQPFLRQPVLSGGAIYVTREGQGGLAKRVAALAQEFELSESDTFLYLRVMPCLLDPQKVKDFIAAIKLLTAAWTVPIRVIGFDTFNRAIVGGSESEGKDVAKLLDADSKIKEAFGCATVYARHPGKAEGNFSRGYSSMQGDPDVIAAFSGKTGTRTIEIKKQKDDEDGAVIGYSLRQV